MFSWDETTSKVPARLTLQVSNDYAIEFNIKQTKSTKIGFSVQDLLNNNMPYIKSFFWKKIAISNKDQLDRDWLLSSRFITQTLAFQFRGILRKIDFQLGNDWHYTSGLASP